MKPLDIEQLKSDWGKDVEARRQYHQMMNYSYLQYKGISLLNKQYSKDTIETMGLSINVPRTFMTIESIRPDLNRPIDITAKPRNKKEVPQAAKASRMLKGEWLRSKADTEKAAAEFNALVFGSGPVLSLFESDKENMPVFDGYDNDGKVKYKDGEYTHYEGMRIRHINPFYSFPDRKARTYQPRQANSRRYHWVYAIWDFDMWMEECKKKGYETEGMEKGGHLEEFDRVRRTMDAIYTYESNRLVTRDNGVMVSPIASAEQNIDWDNAIMVLQRFESNRYSIISGSNWTVNHDDFNPSPKKEIPIYVLKDYDIPDELEGIGEPEVLRWQQYEENKIHNLSYLQTIINTVKRYGIIEEMLVDPTEVKMSNPLKPIRLKFKQGVKVNDAVQALNQHSTEYPQNFLTEVKNIGQSATGQSDYNIGANESQTGTLGEANLMAGAGNKRVRQKIQNMEQEGLAPVLEQWLAGIAQFYTDEIDYLLNDGLEAGVKFIPYGRNINNNAKMVAEYAVREGVLVENVKTVEDVFKAKGYEVVFISDIIGGYDIAIKTSLAALDRQQMLQDYDRAIAKAIAANQESLAMGQPPEWDVNKLTEESFRQFPEIIEDVNDYKLAPEVAGMMQQAVQAKALMGQKPIQQEKPATGPGGPANS